MQRYKIKPADNCTLGFDTSTIIKHRGLGNHHEANSKVWRLRYLSDNSEVINDFKRYLPKLKHVETKSHSNDGATGTQYPVFIHPVKLGVGITADIRNTAVFNADDQGNVIDPTIIVEGTVIDILISVFNGTSEAISGVLHPTLVDSSGTATKLQTLNINNLESFSLFQVSLLATAPMAGLGNLFVIDLNNDQNVLVAHGETPFSTAALFTYTIDWVHVRETRSLGADTLYFYSDYFFTTTPLKGNSLILGDHTNGDQIPINIEYNFALYPTPESYQIFFVCMMNHGKINYNAVEQAAYFTFLFDIASAAMIAGNDKSNSDYDRTHTGGKLPSPIPYGSPLSFNLSTILWYEIIKAILEIDCNGIVIADPIKMIGSDLIFSFDKDNELVHTRTYEGSDSNVGCGPNSRYTLQTTTKRIS